MKVVGQICRVDGRQLKYEEFREKYMKRNEPVLITGLMDEWRASRDWVSDDGRPNLSFIANHFGNSRVQVADCGRREFTDQKRMEMTVTEFVGYWQNLKCETCNMHCDWNRNDSSLLYLKDWHFVKEYPQYVAYTTPMFFSDDWLNLYLDAYYMHEFQSVEEGSQSEVNCSDYRFVYMGPKGTWTPLHADVFRSYSWSANICGKKIWHFLSPSQSHLLYDRCMRHTVYNIYGDVPQKQFPGFSQTSWLECIQEKDEIIFVPSGWYHQVQNVEDTISINHNWFNAYNISWVWDLLLKDYNETREYIEDIRSISDDFESLCQRNLAANTGMNFRDFFIFIIRMAFVNMTQLEDLIQTWEIAYNTNGLMPSGVEEGQQIIFNLISIRNVAQNMESADYFDEHRENKYQLEDKDMTFASMGLLKNFKAHERNDALKATCNSPHTPNIRNSNADCADEEIGRNIPASIFEGSGQSSIDKSLKKTQTCFSNDIFSIFPHHQKDWQVTENFLPRGCWSEHHRVTITNPTHLVHIINDAIALLKKKAVIWGLNLSII